MHNRNVLWIALLTLWLSGCGGDSRGPQPPPSGTVQLLSETALDSTWYGQNRVLNAEFERWTPGNPHPDEFLAPDTRHSQVANAGGAARQTWLRQDLLSDANTLFRTRVPLRSGVTYRVIVLAESRGDGIASLSLWRVTDGGSAELVEPAVITLLPGDGLMKKYTATITVPEGGMHLLAGQATMEPEASFEVTWHRWQVTPVTEEGA